MHLLLHLLPCLVNAHCSINHECRHLSRCHVDRVAEDLHDLVVGQNVGQVEVGECGTDAAHNLLHVSFEIVEIVPWNERKCNDAKRIDNRLVKLDTDGSRVAHCVV